MIALPYALAAADYLEAGWSPIPLPYKEKSPPPDDYTGAAGLWVDKKRVQSWVGSPARKPVRAKAGNLTFIPGNIGLRLPAWVLGIDADMYDGKQGRETIALAEEQWGALPDTWLSTSRTDGSGIRFYAVPEGLRWPGQVGPGVETIRWDHRFAIVAPSIHPKTGGTYHWVRPDGTVVHDEIPGVADLPPLPEAWVQGLTKGGMVWVERDVAGLTEQEVRDWIAARKEGWCDAMHTTWEAYARQLRAAGDDGGAHEVARDAAWALIGDAAAGHGGLPEALARMKKVLVEAVRGRRGRKELDGEWKRIVIRGVQKVAAEGQPSDADLCDLLGGSGAGPSPGAAGSDGSSGSTTGTSSSAFDFSRDDIGNAMRLAARLGTDGRFVPGWNCWGLYDPATGLWRVDEQAAGIRREAMGVVRQMEREAGYIEDPKVQAAFMAHIRASGGLGRLKNMVELAGALKGMEAPAERFDADPTLLVCAGAALVLTESGVEVRGVRHADYATYSTGVPYDASAHYPDWDKFVERVLPDEHTRRWVQTLVGYSLQGGNPERVLVIAKGETTSGKTTFAEALRAALGKYLGPFNLSLFREKQDEGPRADIVGVVNRRLLFAAEASAEWTLHADTIKRFTGGEPVQARRLNSNTLIERVPAFTPWIFTNSYPQIPGADLALWRRLKTAPFVISLPEEEVDTSLRLRLQSPEARAAVLAWAVAGWDLYRRDGLGDPSPEAVLMLAEAQDEMSELDLCISQIFVRGPEFASPAIKLFEAYRNWVMLHGDERRALTLTGFGRALSGKGFAKVRRVGEGGEKVWWRQGIAVDPDWKM